MADATKAVVYDGPFDEVEIAATGQTAKRGEPCEVSAELADALCEQSCWSAAPEPQRQRQQAAPKGDK